MDIGREGKRIRVEPVEDPFEVPAPVEPDVEQEPVEPKEPVKT